MKMNPKYVIAKYRCDYYYFRLVCFDILFSVLCNAIRTGCLRFTVVHVLPYLRCMLFRVPLVCSSIEHVLWGDENDLLC